MKTLLRGSSRFPSTRIVCAWHEGWTSALLLVLVATLAGCGAPGEPTPPSPPIPIAVVDLAGHQVGESVLLTFTMPDRGTLGQPLPGYSTLEILQGVAQPDGALDAKSLKVVEIVPDAMVAKYVDRGTMEYALPVAAQELHDRAGQDVFYQVRMRVNAKRVSPSSNTLALKLYPVPEKIARVQAETTKDGIELRWDAPQKLSGGGAISGALKYNVYRSEEGGSAKKAPLVKIATTSAPEYRDAAFDYDKSYEYTVRSEIAAPVAGGALESSDSPAAQITPRDTFPPETPQGLVATVIPAAAGGAASVELSWSINTERDLAGYRVYRSEAQGQLGEALTPLLLPTPAYRDTSVTVGKTYWYAVTAVDRAGNASPPSAAVAVEITKRGE